MEENHGFLGIDFFLRVVYVHFVHWLKHQLIQKVNYANNDWTMVDVGVLFCHFCGYQVRLISTVGGFMKMAEDNLSSLKFWDHKHDNKETPEKLNIWNYTKKYNFVLVFTRTWWMLYSWITGYSVCWDPTVITDNLTCQNPRN